MHKSLSLVYTNRRRQKEEEALYEIFNFFAGRAFSLRAAKREEWEGERKRLLGQLQPTQILKGNNNNS